MAFPIERNSGNFGRLPLCLTIRSETSGTNQGKMERHFSSKVNFQPDRSVPFTFRPKFRLHHSEMGLEMRIFVNRTARFRRTGPIGQISRSDRTETDLSILLQPKISGNFGLMESTLPYHLLNFPFSSLSSAESNVPVQTLAQSRK